MPDIQDQKDRRGIALDSVGVSKLAMPVAVRRRNGVERTVALAAASVGLPAEARAAHMSRFLTVLGRPRGPLEAGALFAILEDLRRELGSSSARVEFAFTFFVEKRAPKTGSESLLACHGRLAAWTDGDAAPVSESGVRVPVLSVCPCSVGEKGTGIGQRGYVTAAVRPGDALSLDDLVGIVEDSASSPVFPLLRSPDERAVIESALGRPLFVEDLVRGVAERLNARDKVAWYSVSAEDLESVHDHSAIASLTRQRQG